MFSLEHVLEALVFASTDPVSTEAVRTVYGQLELGDEPEAGAVEAAVESLNAIYEATGRVFRIYALGGGYRLATVPRVAPIVKTFYHREEVRRLSRAQMETLAIIAYRQPVTKPEIDFVRGVNSDYALRKLMERDFVAIVGRADAVGRPLLYGTTTAFLDQFGLTALEDLPKPREIEELLNDPAFNAERAALLAHLDDDAPLRPLLAPAPDDAHAPQTVERLPLHAPTQNGAAAGGDGHAV